VPSIRHAKQIMPPLLTLPCLIKRISLQ